MKRKLMACLLFVCMVVGIFAHSPRKQQRQKTQRANLITIRFT